MHPDHLSDWVRGMIAVIELVFSVVGLQGRALELGNRPLSGPSKPRMRGQVRMAFLKRRTERMARGRSQEEWGRRVFQIPVAETRPGIRRELRMAPKRTTSRFYQLLSGHAMAGALLEWTDSD